MILFIVNILNTKEQKYARRVAKMINFKCGKEFLANKRL